MDVVIVGGGMLGTMHAWEAVARGHHVVQLERDAEPRSASVRNFGLIWVSGRRDGAELDLAIRARQRWQELGQAVPGVGFRPNGSLTVARTDAELEVMSKFAATDAATARDIGVVDADKARRINPALGGAILGALHCSADATVEPRVALSALRAVLAETRRYRMVAPRHAWAIASDGAVVDQTGDRHVADSVVLCPGAMLDGLMADVFAAAPLRRCQLQMMQTAPTELAVTTSLADADSMRYYPAYENLDLAPLGAQPSIAESARMQLLLVQRLDGSLTVGDTHSYDEPFPFDVVEAPYEHLERRAEELLGRRLPPVQRRWNGVYTELDPRADVDGAVYYRERIGASLIAVTGLGGRGMTLSPAIAEATAEEMGW